MEDLSLIFSLIIVIVGCTIFAKVLTVLSVLRYGLGIRGMGFGIVVLGFSLVVTWFSMITILGPAADITKMAQSPAGMLKTLEPFLEKHQDPVILGRLEKLAARLAPPAGQSLSTKVAKPANAAEPIKTTEAVDIDAKVQSGEQQIAIKGLAFLITELSEAFQLSFFIILPFLVVDILVMNLMLALGVTAYSHELVSLPLKILLFFAVDGWILLTEKLLLGYTL